MNKPLHSILRKCVVVVDDDDDDDDDEEEEEEDDDDDDVGNIIEDDDEDEDEEDDDDDDDEGPSMVIIDLSNIPPYLRIFSFLLYNEETFGGTSKLNLSLPILAEPGGCIGMSIKKSSISSQGS
jgi:hypothetical protein